MIIVFFLRKEQQQAGERMETDGDVQVDPSSDHSTSNHPDRYWFLEILAEFCLTVARQVRLEMKALSEISLFFGVI